MSFDSLLIHRGTTYRRQPGVDLYGDKIDDFDPHIVSQPCRATVSSLGGGFANLGGERQSETQEQVMEDRRVYFAGNLDVREDDVIEVKDQDGDQVLPMADITFVRKIYDRFGKIHHTELLVKVWRRGDTGAS